jgi:di/tricarboxylate transporter
MPWIKTDANVLESQKHLQSVLKEQYKELGSPNWEERTIIILFIVMIGLWITRDFGTHPGWAIIFSKGLVKNLRYHRIDHFDFCLVMSQTEQSLY